MSYTNRLCLANIHDPPQPSGTQVSLTFAGISQALVNIEEPGLRRPQEPGQNRVTCWGEQDPPDVLWLWPKELNSWAYFGPRVAESIPQIASSAKLGNDGQHRTQEISPNS